MQITHLDTMRPISNRQRYTCLGSLCKTEREENKRELQLIFTVGRPVRLGTEKVGYRIHD